MKNRGPAGLIHCMLSDSFARKQANISKCFFWCFRLYCKRSDRICLLPFCFLLFLPVKTGQAILHSKFSLLLLKGNHSNKLREALKKRSRIRETKNLSTDADSSTDTTVGWTKNTQKPKKIKKTEKIIQNAKTQKVQRYGGRF